MSSAVIPAIDEVENREIEAEGKNSINREKNNRKKLGITEKTR